MKDILGRIKSWAKRSWAEMVPTIAVALAVYILARKFGDFLMCLATWLFVRWVIGVIKKNQKAA